MPHGAEQPRITRRLGGLLLLYLVREPAARAQRGIPRRLSQLCRRGSVARDVYLAWLALAAVGAAGWVLYRTGRRLAGLVLIGAYAAFGFDGLLHYTRAPFAAHTPAMNFTIWFEVAAAALLLLGVLTLAVTRRAS